MKKIKKVFAIKILNLFKYFPGPNIKLECRPHAFTEENVPVYTRTGKVAKTVPFPEDIVRYVILQKILFYSSNLL